MKKITAILILLILLCACGTAESFPAEEPPDEAAISIEPEVQAEEVVINNFCIETAFEMLNQPFFYLDCIDLLNGITRELVYQFADEVRGEFVSVEIHDSIFPESFIEIIKDTLYNSTNYNAHKIFDLGVSENAYFDMLRTLGSEYFELDIDDLLYLFPELYNYKSEFIFIFDGEERINMSWVYNFIRGSRNLVNMFRINTAETEYYVFARTEGSAGIVQIELTKLVEGSFYLISTFEKQNNGFGAVVEYGEFYYYVFLKNNYSTKYFDGIRVHRLVPSAQYENILIRYLPTQFTWRNVYNIGNYNLNEYVESIKNIVTSDRYIERGSAPWGVDTIVGDETITEHDLPGKFFEIDFANTGIPVLFEKSTFTPSNLRTFWHLRYRFHLYDTINSDLIILDNLQVYSHPMTDHNLVQLWFRYIDGEVYTFRIFHVSDYNFVLSVILIRGDEILQIRNDMFSPEREFVLVEGEVPNFGA